MAIYLNNGKLSHELWKRYVLSYHRARSDNWNRCRSCRDYTSQSLLRPEPALFFRYSVGRARHRHLLVVLLEPTEEQRRTPAAPSRQSSPCADLAMGARCRVARYPRSRARVEHRESLCHPARAAASESHRSPDGHRLFAAPRGCTDRGLDRRGRVSRIYAGADRAPLRTADCHSDHGHNVCPRASRFHSNSVALLCCRGSALWDRNQPDEFDPSRDSPAYAWQHILKS